MFRYNCLLLVLSITNYFAAQNNIEWDGKYQVQFSDFQSISTQIGNTGLYSVNATGVFEFEYHMSMLKFVFTKNFNAKVSTFFHTKAASIEAPDSSAAADLLAFARFEFDLAELYARKLRQALFLSKKLFSNQNFYKPIYEKVQTEFSNRYDQAAALTEVGRQRSKLNELQAEVLIQIEELKFFCKSCKPSKTKSK